MFDRERLRINSRPDIWPGYYNIDWQWSVVPHKLVGCVDKVLVYYHPPKKTKGCCDGWKVTEPKYPKKNHDIKPFRIPLCRKWKDNPRKIWVYFFVLGHKAKMDVTLDDNIWPVCAKATTTKPTTTTTTTSTTTTTTGTNTIISTTWSNGSGSSYLDSITLIVCFTIAILF